MEGEEGIIKSPGIAGLLEALEDGERMKQVAPWTLTTPSKWRKGFVCIDDCEACPLAQRGCARVCNRFPDAVCATCPCRASRYAGKINSEGEGYAG